MDKTAILFKAVKPKGGEMPVVMGASDEIIYSLAPKSVTTPIAMEVTCLLYTSGHTLKHTLVIVHTNGTVVGLCTGSQGCSGSRRVSHRVGGPSVMVVVSFFMRNLPMAHSKNKQAATEVAVTISAPSPKK